MCTYLTSPLIKSNDKRRFNYYKLQLHQVLECLRDLEELYLMGLYGRQFEVGGSDGPLLQRFEKLCIAVVDILPDPVSSLLLLCQT